MKRIILFVLLFAALKVAGQTTGYLRYDTVKIMKQGGACELYIINKTKDSLGLLTNVGGGLTRFIKPKMLNDSSIIIGLDTVVIRGASTGQNIANASLTANGDYIQNWDNHWFYLNNLKSFEINSNMADPNHINNTKVFRFYSDSTADATALQLAWGLKDVSNSTTDSVHGEVSSNLVATSIVHWGHGSARYAEIDVRGNVSDPTIDMVVASETKASTLQLGSTTYINPNDSLKIKAIPATSATKMLAIRDMTGNLGTVVAMDIPTSGATLSNAGSGYRLVKTPSGAIKTTFAGYGIIKDSTTNTDGITDKADTSSTNHLVTQSDLNDSAAALRTAIPITLTDTKAFPFINNTTVAGDSYLDNLLYTYMDIIASQFNITYTNLAVSGAQVRRELKELYTNTTTTPTTPFMLSVGFNNFRGRTDSTRRVETVKAAYRSMIANQFAKTFEPPFGLGGVANPKYSFSASTSGATATSEDSLTDWSSHVYWVRHNVTGWGGANWWLKHSITANETITIDSLAGSNLYIQTWACDSQYTIMSRIQYSVDGTTLGTYDPNRKSWDYTESGFIRNGIINDAIVVTGLRDTLHRVVLTFLDGGKLGGIDGVGVLLSPNMSLKQPAFIPALPHMNSTGYAFVPPPVGATEQSLDSATAILKAEIQTVFAGYPIYFPNENLPGYYDPTDATQIQSDGIHPTGKGHYQFYRAILNEISPQKISLGASAGTGSDDLDDVAARDSVTSHAITITGHSTGGYKFRTGTFEVESASADNNRLTNNLHFDASTFRWIETGYGSLIHMLQNSIAFRTAGSGTAGGDAISTFNTPFVVSPSLHVGLGNNMTFDDNLTGATMIVRGDNIVNLPRSNSALNIVSGTLNVNQSSNNGTATLEVTGTGYLKNNINGLQYLVTENTSSGNAAMTGHLFYNDAGKLTHIGIAGTGFTPSGAFLAGRSFLSSNSTTGLLIHSDTSRIVFSRATSATEIARFEKNALLINRTSAVGSELLSVNGKINAGADSVGTATGGYVFRDAATGEFKIAPVSSGPVDQVHTSGTTLTISNGVTRVFVDPASAISFLDITFPSTPADGQQLKIFFGGTINSAASDVVTGGVNSWTVSGSGIIPSPSTAAAIKAGTVYTFEYRASGTYWYWINK